MSAPMTAGEFRTVLREELQRHRRALRLGERHLLVEGERASLPVSVGGYGDRDSRSDEEIHPVHGRGLVANSGLAVQRANPPMLTGRDCLVDDTAHVIDTGIGDEQQLTSNAQHGHDDSSSVGSTAGTAGNTPTVEVGPDAPRLGDSSRGASGIGGAS